MRVRNRVCAPDRQRYRQTDRRTDWRHAVARPRCALYSASCRI